MCSSVTLFEGQFLAVGGFRDGSPECPGLHGQRHLRSQRQLQAERWLVRWRVWKWGPLRG